MDYEPAEFFAGDTVEWTKSLTDYSAADGWALTYALRGPTAKTITATANGSDFDVTIAATATAQYPPGDYWLYGFVSKDGERFEVYRGQVKVLPNPLATAPFDGNAARSHAAKMLAAIEATLENRATREEKSYTVTVEGQERSLELLDPSELLKFRSYYASEVRSEQAAERIAQGRNGGNQVLIRFKSA